MAPKKQILLIDDDPDIHSAIGMILEPRGYKLTCCTTGHAGLEEARRHKPDLILLDVMLADPTEGFHIAYELKKDESLHEVPIIMISAIGQTVEMDFSHEVGTTYLPAVSFVEKPFDAKTVIAAVDTALSQLPASAP